MPAAISTGVVPPGGYWYEQGMADGSWTRIEGGSLDNLYSLILQYRQMNGGVVKEGTLCTPDGVWGDYQQWACGKWPWLCTGVREPPPSTMTLGAGTPGSGFEMLIFRMQRWVDGLRMGAIDWVDQKRATDRAQVCMGCPQNVAWETNCTSCNGNLVQSDRAVLGVRRTGFEQALRGCRAYGTKLDLAVWVDNPGGDNKYEAPPQCWRLTEAAVVATP
jgi:hypothetical protein